VRDSNQQLAELLDALEQKLKSSNLWSNEQPPDDLFLSEVPFCYDRIQFQEWLQWVFLPQIRQLIHLRMPLPGQSSIAPMAEMALKGQSPDTSTVVTLLAEIDSHLGPVDSAPH